MPAALALLGGLATPGDLVFLRPSKADAPLSDMTLAAVLKRMGRAGLTAHGFRSTFQDWAGEVTAHPMMHRGHLLASSRIFREEFKGIIPQYYLKYQLLEEMRAWIVFERLEEIEFSELWQYYVSRTGSDMRYGINYRKAGATRTLRVPGLPATLLVGKEGRERARVLGIAEWDGPQAVEAVRRLLGEGAA